ncbi:hypothetical protein HY090_00155 [Candidatus Kaiserbacteria bacterium]|nr:hypothetical protein [Candidatus Kaiserbacteria bacterium]
MSFWKKAGWMGVGMLGISAYQTTRSQTKLNKKQLELAELELQERKQKQNTTLLAASTSFSKIQEAEENAKRAIDAIKNLSSVPVDSEMRHLIVTQENFKRLRERFKHDKEKLDQIAQDWIDYCTVFEDEVSAREMISGGVGSDEDFEKINATAIPVQEIEKRFENLLGADYKKSQ